MSDEQTIPAESEDTEQPHAPRRRQRPRVRAVYFGVLPSLALLTALGAAYLKYHDATITETQRAGVESVHAAREGAVAMLSYTPDTAEDSLTAARDRLTGTFRDSYAALTREVVIPGAQQQNISATAIVPAAATVSADADHAVALLFINQAIVVDEEAPTQTSSVVQVTLEKIQNRWLISGFDPK